MDRDTTLTLLIDDNLTTALVAVPLADGWVETDVTVDVRGRAWRRPT